MMGALREAIGRMRSFFVKTARDSDVNQDFETHLESAAPEYLRRGLSKDEARRQAQIEFGGRESAKEAHREARGLLPSLDSVLQDTRYALRTLKRDAGFTLFAILIVGLGIGVSTVVFSVFDTLLIRPLPFRDVGRLVWIANDSGVAGLSGATVEVNPFLDLKDNARSFSEVAAYFAFYGFGDSKLIGAGEPERVIGVPVTQNFFQTLGVAPRIGRLFDTEECKLNGPKAVILSYGFWQRRFAGVPNIVGHALTIDNAATTVIGVMPKSFDFASVFAPGGRVDFFLPFPLSPQTDRWGNTLSIVARLKPGVTLERAREETKALCIQLSDTRHWRNDFVPLLSTLAQHVSGELRPALWLLASAVAAVMLIVCANLSNLLLARTTMRQKEIAVRAALGAGRERLMRQLLTESVVLAAAGALLALIVAETGARLLNHVSNLNIPLLSDIRIDGVALAFLAATALLTGLLFGIMPALQVRDVHIQDNLKETSRSTSGSARHNWVRSALVVSEIAFACLLLVGSGLLIRSLAQLLDVHLGFQPSRAVAIRLDMRGDAKTAAQRNAYFDEVLRRIHEIPGVESAGISDTLPLGTNRSWTIGAHGVIYTNHNPELAVYPRIVTDGYLGAMGIELKKGRDISPRDRPGSEAVAVINETLARALWPGQNPIGKLLNRGKDGTEVVGVAGDVRHLALEQSSGNEMYLPIRQVQDYRTTNLVMRSRLPEHELAARTQAVLRELNPTQPFDGLLPMQQLVDRSVSPRRFTVMLLSGFAAFALILASLGIYAVISYSVSQHTHEIGIRMVLGETALSLQRGILARTLRLAAIGMAGGALASWLMARALSSLLFGVKPADPSTFAVSLTVLLAVAALAGFIPAFRASRIDPVEALRVN